MSYVDNDANKSWLLVTRLEKCIEGGNAYVHTFRKGSLGIWFLRGWSEVPILMRRNRASRPSKVEVNPDDELSMYVCDYTYKTPWKFPLPHWQWKQVTFVSVTAKSVFIDQK